MSAEKRLVILRGTITKVKTGMGILYVTINIGGNKKPVEVILNIGKSGGDTAALAEALGRLISIALQANVPIKYIYKTLIGISGSPIMNGSVLIKSIPDGVGQVLESVSKGESFPPKKEDKEFSKVNVDSPMQDV